MDLQRRISELESLNDQLLTELRYLDHLLVQIGFEEGIISLKNAAEEMISHDEEED